MFDELKRLFPKRGRAPRPAPAADEVDRTSDLDDLSWLWPPTDLHDAAAWDTYWKNQVSHGVVGLTELFCDDDAMIRVLRENDLHTVLCVGSGVALEPCRLAAAGLDVTVLDLSPYAMGLMERVAAARPPAPRFVVGDLMDPSVCPGPFDVIIERRTLQLFPDDERPAALQAVANRLAGRGVFFSHCHDGGWRPPAEPHHRTRSWFEETGWEIWRQRPATLRTRAAWLVMSTG